MNLSLRRLVSGGTPAGSGKTGLVTLGTPRTSRAREIPEDGMLAVAHLGSILVKPGGSFARISQPDDSPGPAQASHQGTTQQALQVQRNIGLQ